MNKWDDLNNRLDWNDFIDNNDRLQFAYAEAAYCQAENDTFHANGTEENRKAWLDKRQAFLLEVVKYRKHDIRLKSQTTIIFKPKK